MKRGLEEVAKGGQRKNEGAVGSLEQEGRLEGGKGGVRWNNRVESRPRAKVRSGSGVSLSWSQSGLPNTRHQRNTDGRGPLRPPITTPPLGESRRPISRCGYETTRLTAAKPSCCQQIAMRAEAGRCSAVEVRMAGEAFSCMPLILGREYPLRCQPQSNHTPKTPHRRLIFTTHIIIYPYHHTHKKSPIIA